ncbi:hypothetical protein [Dyadobacter sp. 676]|uniref:Peptidase M61 N-terminal domain-containing protein n=1 Tax=Dyadobacter sp. 676 TaxID=3088362 RepID=A0AAU8FIP8_9BACT
MAALLATPMLCTYALAQTIHYDVSFPHIVHHEVRIALSVPDLSRKELLFGMSRSSPGRYATHEYGKNVHDVAAFRIQPPRRIRDGNAGTDREAAFARGHIRGGREPVTDEMTAFRKAWLRSKWK